MPHESGRGVHESELTLHEAAPEDAGPRTSLPHAHELCTSFHEGVHENPSRGVSFQHPCTR